MLDSRTPFYGTTKVEVGKGDMLPIKHVGSASIATSARPLLVHSNVYHVPDFARNILSVKESNYVVIIIVHSLSLLLVFL